MPSRSDQLRLLFMVLCVAAWGACVDLTAPAARPAVDAGDSDGPEQVVDVNAAGLLGLGAACKAGDACRSGFCVDGLCCESACTGGCRACNLAATRGLCEPVPEGQDPGDECATEPTWSCGRDGTCDGRGACRLHAVGTSCAPKACTDSTEQSERTCDGQGTCRPSVAKSCAPFRCAGTACSLSCQSAADCGSGSTCTAGKCSGLLPNGSTCNSSAQCHSSFCVDGVCCQSACAGVCQACNLAGSAGSCLPVAAGEDPANECALEGPSTCGKDGACNGAGACRLYAVGTPCAASTCAAGQSTGARSCDGGGVCRSSTTVPCAPYICGAGACKTGCSSDADCDANGYCAEGTCFVKKTAGASCSRNDECATASCASGVCCDAQPTLVAFWDFDEAAGQSVGDNGCHRNQGTVEPSAAQWATGKRDGALRLSGSQWVRVPSSASLNAITTKLSIVGWVYKEEEQVGFRPMVTRQYLAGAEDDDDLFWFGLNDGYPRFGINRWDDGDRSCTAGATVPLGTWTHLAGTWDGATGSLYVNGVRVCTFARTAPMPTDSTPVILGGNVNTSGGVPNELLSGRLDDIAIYSRTLTAQEIAAVAAGGAPPR